MSQYDRPHTQLSTESTTAENEALALTLVKSASLGDKKGQRLFAEVTSVQILSPSGSACHSPCTLIRSSCYRG